MLVSDALQPLGKIDNRTRLLAEYWFSLPKIELVPDRNEFKPEHVPTLLPYMGIHELVSPVEVKMRLAGGEIERAYGQTLAGRNYLDFVEHDRRRNALRAFQLVCEHPAGMLAQLRSMTTEGQILTHETIAFPMRATNGQINLIYFCSSDAIERRPVVKPPSQMQVIKVLKRTYIDIGAGVPEFAD
jgi:hypothetical protein